MALLFHWAGEKTLVAKGSQMMSRTLLLTACFLAAIAAAASARPFSVQTIANFTPVDMNNRGQIVGNIGNSRFAGEAAVWSDGTTTPIGVLPGYSNTWVSAINDSCQVVGYCYGGLESSSNVEAFLWQPGAGMIDLGTFSGASSSRACSINNLGQVVGYVGGEDDCQPFIWEVGTGMRGMDLLAGCDHGLAADINDSGNVVGMCFNGEQDKWGIQLAHPFVWSDSLGMISCGPVDFHPCKINNRGQVVGAIPGWYWCEPFLLQPDGTQVDMSVSPTDINNLGEVVGDSDTDLGGFGFFRGTDGGVECLIDGTIVAINDRQQIVTSDGRLITLTPEPAGDLALLAGLASLGTLFRRRKA